MLASMRPVCYILLVCIKLITWFMLSSATGMMIFYKSKISRFKGVSHLHLHLYCIWLHQCVDSKLCSIGALGKLYFPWKGNIACFGNKGEKIQHIVLEKKMTKETAFTPWTWPQEITIVWKISQEVFGKSLLLLDNLKCLN